MVNAMGSKWRFRPERVKYTPRIRVSWSLLCLQLLGFKSQSVHLAPKMTSFFDPFNVNLDKVSQTNHGSHFPNNDVVVRELS